jgi:hypothetical protein
MNLLPNYSPIIYIFPLLPLLFLLLLLLLLIYFNTILQNILMQTQKQYIINTEIISAAIGAKMLTRIL